MNSKTWCGTDYDGPVCKEGGLSSIVQPKSGVQQEIELIEKNLATLRCVSTDLSEKL